MKSMVISESLYLKVSPIIGSVLTVGGQTIMKPNLWDSALDVAFTALIGATVAFIVTKGWNFLWRKLNL